jgi:hypothetical protein
MCCVSPLGFHRLTLCFPRATGILPAGRRGHEVSRVSRRQGRDSTDLASDLHSGVRSQPNISPHPLWSPVLALEISPENSTLAALRPPSLCPHSCPFMLSKIYT